jgi:hypothetical protein
VHSIGIVWWLAKLLVLLPCFSPLSFECCIQWRKLPKQALFALLCSNTFYCV